MEEYIKKEGNFTYPQRILPPLGGCLEEFLET